VAAAILEKEHVPAPDGWTRTFTDPRLCAAIVDRLTFGGNIIQTGTESYRLASTRARAEQQGTAEG
jgi:DNA replication protein DnaC